MSTPRATPIGTIRTRAVNGRFMSSQLYYDDQWLCVTDCLGHYTITHKPTTYCFGHFVSLRDATIACKLVAKCGVDWSQKKPKYSKDERALVEPIVTRFGRM